MTSSRCDTGAPWYDVYETADGKWLAVGCIEARFYAEFVRNKRRLEAARAWSQWEGATICLEPSKAVHHEFGEI